MIHSFLIIGQSNMAGRGVPPADEPLMTNRGKIKVLRNGRWQTMFRPVNPDRHVSGTCLAESFAVAYSNDHPDVEVGIIPCADGGWLHFDYTPGEQNIRKGGADFTGRLCVIGSKLKEEGLKALFGV